MPAPPQIAIGPPSSSAAASASSSVTRPIKGAASLRQPGTARKRGGRPRHGGRAQRRDLALRCRGEERCRRLRAASRGHLCVARRSHGRPSVERRAFIRGDQGREVCGQRLGRRPSIDPTRQHRASKRVDALGQRGLERARLCGRLEQDLREHRYRVIAAERGATGQALEQHAAEREHVGAPIDRVRIADLLGRHVAGRSSCAPSPVSSAPACAMRATPKSTMQARRPDLRAASRCSA